MTIKHPYNFKRINSLAFVFTLIGFIYGLSRIFHFDEVLSFFPKYSGYLFDVDVNESQVSGFEMITSQKHLWKSSIYLGSSASAFIAVIFILKKKIIVSFRFLQFSLACFLFVIFYIFAINIKIRSIDTIEIIFVFLFLTGLYYHFLHLRKNGWFWFSSTALKTVETLNVQRGCQYSCGFSITPEIQGLTESDTLDHIIDSAEKLALNGVKEIILHGDDVGNFGKGHLGDLDHEHTFLDLMKEMDKVGEIERFRFSTISTPLISKKTLTFFSESRRFSPHFSIGMQSGSNEMLKLIPRVYKREQYEELFNNIKELMPHAYISVEIIVGFPGETNELFEETYNFLKKLITISHINVTAYSENKKDLGHKIKEGVVLKDIRIKRRKILNELSEEKLTSFYKSQLGGERNVLFEAGKHDGFIYGYTKNHMKVKLAWSAKLENTVHKVKFTNIDNDGFMLFDFIYEKPTNTKNHKI